MQYRPLQKGPGLSEQLSESRNLEIAINCFRTLYKELFESRPVRRRGYSNVASFCLCPVMFTSCKVKRIVPFTKDFQKTLISGYWNTIPDCLPILKQKFPGNWFISKNALINQQLCQGKGI